MILLFLFCWLLAVILYALGVGLWHLLEAHHPEPPELIAARREHAFWRAQAQRWVDRDDGGPSNDDRSLSRHSE